MNLLEFRTELQETWTTLFPGVQMPADHQFALWLLLHDATTVRTAFAQLATKYRKVDGRMDAGYMVKFASAVMNRLQREAETVKA
jgi:hypothetical protein